MAGTVIATGSFQGADMSLLAQLDQHIRHHGGLIVSCQPVPGSPLDNPAIVAAMGLAAEQAGAVALRIEGLANLQAVRPLVTVPVIALIKRDLHDSPVRITPWLEDVNALAQAGADIIAVDGTRRQRPASVASLLAAIHHQGKMRWQIVPLSTMPLNAGNWASIWLAPPSQAIPQRRHRSSRIWRW